MKVISKNHSLFYPDNLVSCVCRVLNIDEGTEISDRVDMHHASYQSALSLTHHLEISSSTRRHGDFIRQRSYTPFSAFNLTRLRSAASGDTSCWSTYYDFNNK